MARLFEEAEHTGQHVDVTDFGALEIYEAKKLARSWRAARRAADGQGRKDDQGKLPWGLLPFDAIEQVVHVLRFGANKYKARNWERGMAWSRPFDALLRHMTAWHRGETRDPETGLPHLAHAGCCLLFLLAMEVRSSGTDDRPLGLYAKPREPNNG